MKKLNLIFIAMSALLLTGCYMQTSEAPLYEYCDAYGHCWYSTTPPWEAATPQPQHTTEIVYVYEESPAPSSHSHDDSTNIYYDDSHNHTEVIIVEDNGYDPYYYEFTNNFQEFCYAEGTPYKTTTCWVEYCYDHWLGGGWYLWDEWCE